MSAQPVHQPAPPPAPSAAARLRQQIRAHAHADRWAPAFDRDWRHALDQSRETYDLSPLHDVVRTWQGRLATAPAVARFIESGHDTSDGVSLDQVLGTRR